MVSPPQVIIFILDHKFKRSPNKMTPHLQGLGMGMYIVDVW